MSKTVTVAGLEARKADLQRQLREIDGAIKAAKAREIEKKTKAITAALAARGLLDGDLGTVLAAIASATPSGTAQAPALPVEPAQIPSTASGY